MIIMRENAAGSILKKAGLKRTPGRMALVRVLAEARFPLTRQEISQKLPPGLKLDQASVYRCLDAFFQAGLIHRVETGDRVWRFALCGCGSRGHCHPHFICNSCGRTECLREIKLPHYSRVKKGYVVQEQEYYLRGLCGSCAGSFAGTRREDRPGYS